ncbi:MAG: hypothetical protein ACLQUZ_06235 [Rhizomicrobium sp.]
MTDRAIFLNTGKRAFGQGRRIPESGDTYYFQSGAPMKKIKRCTSPLSKCRAVQFSDYVYGDRTIPERAVPGDGAIPLDRLVGWVLDAGYTGAFDMELGGPRIRAEGELAAARRVRRLYDRLVEPSWRLTDKAGKSGAFAVEVRAGAVVIPGTPHT